MPKFKLQQSVSRSWSHPTSPEFCVQRPEIKTPFKNEDEPKDQNYEVQVEHSAFVAHPKYHKPTNTKQKNVFRRCFRRRKKTNRRDSRKKQTRNKLVKRKNSL
ncbi:unnamed protein product [Ambrosiozyma monospora]|uniref:Unnamed protein product n=1 Tax=Ambrosiozyma monospora TaxID=43982 RepID=A0ACB5SYR9_AMBMO|nr:unnamed protein product [Ambrosiozyma monospora]